MKHSRLYGFTLVEVMVVIFIITVLLMVAVPGFIYARNVGQTRSCIANMRAIEDGKQQLLIRSQTITAQNLVGPDCPLKTMPCCPSNHAPYSNLGDADHEVTCPSSIEDHVLHHSH